LVTYLPISSVKGERVKGKGFEYILSLLRLTQTTRKVKNAYPNCIDISPLPYSPQEGVGGLHLYASIYKYGKYLLIFKLKLYFRLLVFIPTNIASTQIVSAPV
jgi:hypothetical protein